MAGEVTFETYLKAKLGGTSKDSPSYVDGLVETLAQYGDPEEFLAGLTTRNAMESFGLEREEDFALTDFEPEPGMTEGTLYDWAKEHFEAQGFVVDDRGMGMTLEGEGTKLFCNISYLPGIRGMDQSSDRVLVTVGKVL